MESLHIERTEETPYILADIKNNKIEFIGKSYPENTFDYYEPILVWLKEYFSEKRFVDITVDLEYLNSSSLKAYFDIFDIFEKSFETKQSDIKINWLYDKENDISQETGEDFKLDFEDLDIKLVEKEER